MYEKLKKTLREKNISTNKLALMSQIAPSDLYAALNGAKPMYPNWKRRICNTLGVDENELFKERG